MVASIGVIGDVEPMLEREAYRFYPEVFPLGMQEGGQNPDPPEKGAWYYPFGLKMPGLSYVASGSDENKFTYNGKELQDEFNLNWYHYGARYYDPVVGRWWALDPVEEFHSPYTYVGNDPLRFIDPNGMFSSCPECYDGGSLPEITVTATRLPAVPSYQHPYIGGIGFSGFGYQPPANPFEDMSLIATIVSGLGVLSTEASEYLVTENMFRSLRNNKLYPLDSGFNQHTGSKAERMLTLSRAGKLKYAGKGLTRLSYGLSAYGAILDTDAYLAGDGDMGGDRYGYRMAGYVAPIAVGIKFGGHYGAVLGLGFAAGELGYDTFQSVRSSWSVQLGNIEHSMKNGIYPNLGPFTPRR